MIKTISIIILSVTFFGVLFFILVRNALKRKLDQLVEEEILYWEALSLGLDKDDIIIKRRLAQKIGFLNIKFIN